MITLITYLTYPKRMTFHGLTYKNIEAMRRFMEGPNYGVTIVLDVLLILAIGFGICLLINQKLKKKNKK